MITALVLVLYLSTAAAALESEPFAFTNVTVVDVTDGSLRPEMSVLVRGDRIVLATQHAELAEGTRVVDATGKYLIPGLWDMHVHWYAKKYLPLFVANGVTGVRQMFGHPDHLKWRKEFREGRLDGPRLVVASRIVDGPKPIWPGSIAVKDAEQGRAAVHTAIREGADFVKVYSLLSREAYFAITAEAAKNGLPFAGHVPVSVTAGEASDAGQQTIEHLTGVLLASSSEETKIRRAWGSDGRSWLERNNRLVETYDADKARALFSRFAKNGTWQCPTLTVLRNIAMIPDRAILDDPNLKYMPPQVRAMWDPDRVLRWIDRQGYEKAVEIVGEMRNSGVRFLAGTDVLNPYCFPGFSLHGELQLLVRAGLTPLEALQAATLNPAEFLEMRDELGTVAEGKLADLVLLDGNPLENIGNTVRIAAVVMNGRLFRRGELDAMLADVEQQASPKVQP